MTPALTIRRLGPGDEAEFESFLAGHADSSLFLLANAAAAGLEYHGQRLQGVYVGVYRGDALCGVACHAWQGNLLLQAPGCVEVAARACAEESGRAVAGLLGPWEQVCDARDHLGLAGADTLVAGRPGGLGSPP